MLNPYIVTGSWFNVQGYLSAGFTESEFSTARSTAGEVQGCLFHAFTGSQPLVGFNGVVIR
jgi:hypothetical protein